MTMQGSNGNGTFEGAMNTSEENLKFQMTIEQRQIQTNVNTLTTSVYDEATQERLNGILDNNFLENLKKGLHPDEAEKLEERIRGVDGFDIQGTPLNNLYNYVLGICKAFNVDAGKDHDIKNSLQIKSILTKDMISLYNERIDMIEYINLIANDEELGNRLVAIKGIINGTDDLSGNNLAKIADYLGIRTKNDDKYDKIKRLNKLGEKVFSTKDLNGLYMRLQTEYFDLLKSKQEEIQKFKENPFAKFSLTDICNKLIRVDWSGKNLEKDDANLVKFCNKRGIDIEGFVNNFKVKNKERTENNKACLGEINIVDKIAIGNVSFDAQNNKYYYQEGENKVELDVNKLIELLSGKIELGDVHGGTFVSDQELVNTMKENFVTEARFGQIKQALEDNQSEQKRQSEIPETKEFTVNDFDEGINLFNGKTKEEIVAAINEAKKNIQDVDMDNTDKKIYVGRINDVVDALINGGEKFNGNGSKSIEGLQEDMNGVMDEIGLNKRLLEDGKLGRNTFIAMKKYLGVETTKKENLLNELNPNRLAKGQQEILNAIDDSDALTKLGIKVNEGENIQEVAESYLTNPRKYLKFKLSNVGEIPGKNKIVDIVNRADGKQLRYLQLALLPEYTGKIDGAIGPKTLTAMETYINKKWEETEKTDTNIKPLLSEDKGSVKGFEFGNEQSFIKINCDDENCTNNKLYFFDGSIFDFADDEYKTDNNEISGVFTYPDGSISGTITFNGASCSESSYSDETRVTIIKQLGNETKQYKNLKNFIDKGI